jgi:aryl-alcohol dehydrogenase-like predicted oxidoreductase
MSNAQNRLMQVQLGRTGRHVGMQGLGCMGISEFYGATNSNDVNEMLEVAIELGVNMFDTADMYGLGENEEFLGPWVRKYRNDILIATKFGYTRTRENPDDWSIDNRADYIKKAIERSLKRMKIDCIDLYYMHRRSPDTGLEESVGAMAELVEQGKVHALGLSGVGADELRQANAIHPIAALQSEWSLFSREVESTIIPTAVELGITFVPYAPLGRGLLTAEFRQVSLSSTDARNNFPRFAKDNIESNQMIVDRVSQIANNRGITTAQLSLAWLYTRAEQMHIPIIPIPGTRRKSRLIENVTASSIRLTVEEMAALEFFAGQVKGIAM